MTKLDIWSQAARVAEITTRVEAAKRGLRKYFTGRACNKGHLTFRYTNTGACIECIAGYARIKRGPVRKPYYVTFKLLDPQDEPRIRKFVEAINAARDLQNSS